MTLAICRQKMLWRFESAAMIPATIAHKITLRLESRFRRSEVVIDLIVQMKSNRYYTKEIFAYFGCSRGEARDKRETCQRVCPTKATVPSPNCSRLRRSCCQIGASSADLWSRKVPIGLVEAILGHRTCQPRRLRRSVATETVRDDAGDDLWLQKLSGTMPETIFGYRSCLGRFRKQSARRAHWQSAHFQRRRRAKRSTAARTIPASSAACTANRALWKRVVEFP
jgi:hypothetical protein